MEKLTQITLAWDLFQQGLPKARIAQPLGRHRETIILRLQGIEQHGLSGFLAQHQAASKQPRPARQVRLSTKQLIWAIREREHGCCGQKIAYFLQQEHQISLSIPKIYEVLAQKYTLHSKWQKNHKRGQVPEAEAPRQVVQMDTVDFGQVFAFTAVDIHSREADAGRLHIGEHRKGRANTRFAPMGTCRARTLCSPCSCVRPSECHMQSS